MKAHLPSKHFIQLLLLVCLAFAFLAVTQSASADTAAQTLPFSQNWTNTGLITTSDDWSGVPGIIGYRGDGLVAITAVDPQTVVADGSATPIDVNANNANPNTFATGGVTEFAITDPVVALQGSGTADAPHIVITLNTTGQSNIQVQYNLRDVDGAADDAIQPIALQYRVGTSGNYTNIPAGFVADASSGPSLATKVTPINVTLPAAADNQSTVQLRVITTDAVGSDEWIGIDDIKIGDFPPTVTSTVPANNATDVEVNATVTINFSESVDVTAAGAAIECPLGSPITFTGLPANDVTSVVLTPTSNLPFSTVCDVAIIAAEVTDNDGTANAMATDYEFSFTTRAADLAPTVTSTTPTDGATGTAVTTDVTVTFSEAVTASTSSFSIVCAASGTHSYTLSGGPTTYTLNPDTDFNNGEICTVTADSDNVTDQDVDDPPDEMAEDYTFSFTTVGTAAFIHDIQGAAHISPLVDELVAGVPGIVTFVRPSSFYLQDPNPDADDETSEGIIVFTGTAPTVVAGDSVTVDGTVTEFRPNSAANLTVTEITGPTVSVLSSGNPLPARTVIGSGGRVPPTTEIDDDATGSVETSGTFDAATDGIDFYESLEGMLVQINDAQAVSRSTFFGGTSYEVAVVPDACADATLCTPRGGILLQENDWNPEIVYLANNINSDGLPTNMNVGDTFTTPVEGILDYNFANFLLYVTNDLVRVDNGLAREITAAQGTNQLAVATFNVENLAPGDPDAKFDALAANIVTNLQAPDIIGIEEIQDNNGVPNDSVVAADVTFDELIQAISDAGGPTYQYRQINPVDDQDGGAPGGNIRVGFLFRTDRGVAFVDRGAGTSTSSTTVVNGPQGPELSDSPGRLDPTNSAFNSSRKPLAAEFTYNGQTFFIIVNHWNSKGGDDPLYGHTQPPVFTSETQRTQQATIVRNFVQSILALDSDANVIVLGDLNDFHWSTPLETVLAAPLHALIETLPTAEQYGYVFDGNSQALDHILLSDRLFNTVPFAFDILHINSEFSEQTSDHDASVVRLTVPPPPTNTPTNTPLPTLTNTPTNTPLPTPTSTPTNTTIPGPTNTPLPTRIEDTHARVRYRYWEGLLVGPANGGSHRLSNTANSTAALTFNGSSVTWLTKKDPNAGTAIVLIDGLKKGEFDLHSPTVEWNHAITFSGLGAGTHTITIKVKGGGNISVDAFVVGATTIQDTSPEIRYDNWVGSSQPSASNGVIHSHSTAGVFSRLLFSGTSINWITARGPAYGKLNLYVDGSNFGSTIDLYNPTQQNQYVIPIAGLSPGQHLVEVRVLGQKNAASSGTGVVIDAFEGNISVPNHSRLLRDLPVPLASFEAKRTQINKGKSVKLTWDVENAKEVYLFKRRQAPELVAASGKLKISPHRTTRYYLRVVGWAGETADYELRIKVNK